MQRLVEADLGDGRARDRGQQGAAQGHTEGVAEAGLQGADGEALPVAFLLAQGLDGRTLDDQHGDGVTCLWTWLLRVELDDQRLPHGHVDVLAPGRRRGR